MQSYYVGLDVHSRESVFVVENEAGAIVARGSVPTTVNGLKHLRDSCGLPAATGVALETGTSAFFVARELARLELKPVVIDAHEVRRKAQRPEQKSDTPRRAGVVRRAAPRLLPLASSRAKPSDQRSAHHFIAPAPLHSHPNR